MPSTPPGYQLHVLGYVVHSLLFSLVEGKHGPGSVSAALGPLTEVLMVDLIGTVGQEKEVTAPPSPPPPPPKESPQ